MNNVRLRLGDPRANTPNNAVVLHQVCSHARTVLRHRRNTGNVWDFADAIVDVNQGEDTYRINATDFGTPLAVITKDDSNPNHITRIIPFYCPQNLAFDWGQPKNFGAYLINVDGSFHSALRCGIFWRANQPYIQFQPEPYLSCQYVVRYTKSANGVEIAALDTEPVQSEDCDLIEIRAARSCLPMTEWDDGSNAQGRAANAERRRSYAESLTMDEQLAQRQFDAAQLITTGPRIHTRWSNVEV